MQFLNFTPNSGPPEDQLAVTGAADVYSVVFRRRWTIFTKCSVPVMDSVCSALVFLSCLVDLLGK